jgi:hypothetical protein
MSDAVVSNTILDYSLVRYYNVPNTTVVKFCTGFLFPNNKDLVKAVWDFGDGVSNTSTLSSSSYSSILSSIDNVNGFFPAWTTTTSEDKSILIPKFETSHTYAGAGSYNVNVTLIDSSGVSYTGETSLVNVVDNLKVYTVPEDWANISQTYTAGTDINFLLATGTPSVQTNVSPVSSLPLTIDYEILNIQRIDIDYIEWSFGDGTVDVYQLFGSPVTTTVSRNTYTYRVMPSQLVYEPQVTLYFKNKTKYKLQVPTIPTIDTSNICFGIADSNTDEIVSTAPFNITPVLSYDLPVEVKFISIIDKNLKYILWNYNDGEYDVVPVTYSTSLSNVVQTQEVTHKYTSLNYYGFYPTCVYIYEDSGSFYARSFKPSKLLNYQLGLVDNQIDSTGAVATGVNYYIYSTTNYQKYQRISSLVEYPSTNTGFAKLHLRLSLDLPDQILFFEKIIWEVGDRTITQIKNTSEGFGTITLDNVPTSSTLNDPINITATLYGIPAIFADAAGDNFIVEYDTYSRTVNVNDKDYQETINAESRANLLLEPPAPTIITTDEGVTIITPIVDTSVVTVEVETPVYIGSNIVFETLFKASNPVGNFLNRYYPTLASTPSNNLVTKRVIGFFRPSKTTPIIVDPGKFSFTLNLESLEYNKPYYFPDPYKYGSNTNVLDFFSLTPSFKKNARLGFARNEPNQPADSISFYGYNSSKSKNINSVVDSGYFHDQKEDIYGNVYGLLKDSNNFRQNIDLSEIKEVLYLQLNGYKFYDDIFGENNSFNYSLTGILDTQTIRSGLSTVTNGFSARSSQYYTLNFGDFNRITAFIPPTEVIDINTQYLQPRSVGIRDGAYFTLNDTELLPDSIRSDLSGFPGTGTYYFSSLYEAGVHTAVPYVRPLSGFTPSLSAIFTQSVRVSANNGVIDVDGGIFLTSYNINENFYSLTESAYVDSVNPEATTTYTTTTAISTGNIVERDSLLGSVIVSDPNGNYDNIFNKLTYMQSKYPQSVYQNLTAGILNFDMGYNNIILQSSNYLVCDKISVIDGVFTNPKTANIITSYNNDLFNSISNRYKVNNNIYFATLSTYGTPDTSTAFVYPIINKLDLDTFKLQQIFPDTAISNYEADFKITTDGVLYVQADSPHLTYNTDLDMFNISYVLKDQNKLPYLFNVNFRDSVSDIIDSTFGYKFGANNVSTLFTSISSLSSSFTTFIQGGNYTFNNYLRL